MSRFHKFAIVSFAVLALGAAAEARGGGGGAGAVGNGEPGGVMNPAASPIAHVVNPNRGKRPGRGRSFIPLNCSGGWELSGPAHCQWN